MKSTAKKEKMERRKIKDKKVKDPEDRQRVLKVYQLESLMKSKAMEQHTNGKLM